MEENDEFTSTKAILRQNGYTEEVDDKSMPLVAHMLNDIQKLQIKLLSHNANESASEERIAIVLKELEEATQEKQKLNGMIESLKREIAAQKEVVSQLKQVAEKESKPPIPMNEYVEMVHSLTMEKDSISKENLKLSNQHVLDGQQLAAQSQLIRNQKEEIEKLTKEMNALRSRQSSEQSYQKQIEELQNIYRTIQQNYQKQSIDFSACKEREQSLSIQLTETKNTCRVTEENLRNEKSKNLELMESNSHFQSLLQIQQGTTTDLENSLKQEKALTNQLQLKLQSSQRLNTEAQQKLRDLGGRIETYQKHIKEAEDRERETYKQLEEKRKEYDELLVEQIANRSTVERLTNENKIQKEALERLQKTQDELDQRIRTLQIQESTHLQENGKLKNEIEEKARWMKEMEQMMNTERTRSLLEVSQLKEALLKKKRSYFTQTVNATTEEDKVPDTTKLFPSINATPIKVVDSPIKEKGETSTTGLSEMISNLSNAVNELESQV